MSLETVVWCKEKLNVNSTGSKDSPKLNTLPELQNLSPENWLPILSAGKGNKIEERL